MLQSVRRCVLVATRNIQSSFSCAANQSFNGFIPTELIEKRFCLSSGPGGQNVQKNATKVEIRFKVDEATWLPDELKNGLKEKFAHRLNAKGEFIVDSDRTRERHLNIADCFDKLRFTLYSIQNESEKRETTEEDKKILRERAASAAQRRLAEKRKMSEKKMNRRAHVEL